MSQRWRMAWWLVVIGVGCLGAQDISTVSSVMNGPTPPAIKPGGPAGSYPLNGFERINYYNGRVDASLPVLKIGGRGEAEYTVNVRLTRPSWTVKNGMGSTLPTDPPWVVQYYYATGPNNEWWNPFDPGYGPGTLVIKYSADNLVTCNGDTKFTRTLTNLVFTSGDGTEHTLYSVNKPDVIVSQCNSTTFVTPPYDQNQYDLNRGTVFESRDGSGITFVATNYSFGLSDYAGNELYPDHNVSGAIDGTLTFPGGIQYTIQSGLVRKIRDRNGNFLTFAYKYAGAYETTLVEQVTDSLGRVTSFEYDASDNDLGVCDRINFPGTNGQRTIRIKRADHVSERLRDDYASLSTATLFPEMPGWPYSDSSSIGPVVSGVYLPNWQPAYNNSHANHYEFYYSIYGELARVVLPTGGAIEYDHGAGVSNSTNVAGVYPSGQVMDQVGVMLEGAFTTPVYSVPSIPWHPYIYRRLHVRRVYQDGGSSHLNSNWTSRTTYSRPEAAATSAVYEGSNYVFWVGLNRSNYIEVTREGTDTGTVTERHYYYTDNNLSDSGGAATSLSQAHELNLAVRLEYEGREYRSEVVGKRSVESAWGLDAGQVPRVCQAKTTLLDETSPQTSTTVHTYDSYGNVTNTYEFDYATNGGVAGIPAVWNGDPNNPINQRQCQAPTSGGYLRRTQTDYKTDAAYIAVGANLRSLPVSSSVLDASEATRAFTSYTYDGTGPAVTRTGVPGLETPSTPRGNLTSLTRSASFDGVEDLITTTMTYDSAGNAVSVTDGRGNTTDYDYDCSYAYLSSITQPPVNAANERFTRGFGYQCSTGKLTGITDVHGVTTTVTYNDALDRPTSVTRDSAATTYAYSDLKTDLAVTASKKQNSAGTQWVVSKEGFDSLGRRTKTATGEGTSAVEVERLYDGFDRVRQVSSPAFSSSTKAWTTTVYDALNRATSVTHPDGSVSTNSYAGNLATITDEAGKVRQTQTDAFGRLTSVTEDPAGSNYATSYGYDVLDNLTSVTQGTQTRSFAYDSMKRLRRATNPETGASAVAYQYDGNGNLTQKTANGVVTTLQYDALNRVRVKSYSDGNTPAVTLCYDGLTVSGGTCGTGASLAGAREKLSAAYTSGSTTTYTYDSLGRVVGNTQQTGGMAAPPPSFGYSYNVDDTLATMTYPAGRVVTTCYDSLGRVKWLSGTAGADCGNAAGPAGSYATSVVYSYPAAGPRTETTLGNGLVETVQSNWRGQAVEMSLGTVWTLANDYGSSGNNGNVRKQTLTAPGMAALRSVFDYDGLNRLEKAAEYAAERTEPACPDATSVWCQGYDYGRWGNRRVTSRSGLGAPLSEPEAYDATSNHVTGTGWGYDAAGNVSATPGSRAFVYDAENRLRSQTSPVAVEYVYDGEGRRVKMTAGAASTYYVYDAMGQLAAEYGGTAAGMGRAYLTADQLGSTRVVTDAGGGVVERRDYLPFGEEITVSAGSPRYGIAGYGSSTSGVTQQFTGKERDAETGLDYFGARYFSGAQGRFTSPDPVIVTPARVIDPQRFNLYAYARNNPFKFIDPRGEDIELVNDTEEGRKKALALITRNMKAREAANIGIRQKKDGSYEAYVIDKKAVGKDASVGYKQVTGLINDHSVTADVGVIGGGLTATFRDLGRVSSFSEHSAVIDPAAGNTHVSVLVTQGDVPGGTQLWCCGGNAVYQGWQPDFVTMYHELVGETLKYRAGYGQLRGDPTLDSRTVIKIENEIRQFHGMNPRTGADHGMTVITVNGKVQ